MLLDVSEGDLPLSATPRRPSQPNGGTASGGTTAERRASTGSLDAVSSATTPIVDPIRRPHLAAVDPGFRKAIEREIEDCRELLAYLRDR